MSADEFAGMGFAPGSVHGVRSFKVDRYGRLTGVSFKKVWTPGENVSECLAAESGAGWGAWSSIHSLISIPSYTYDPRTGSLLIRDNTPKQPFKLPANVSKYVDAPAELEPTPHVEPTVPERTHFQDCQCGFYGYFDGSDDYHSKGTGMVTAVVEAYGETIIGTRGFRAKKAKIVALRLREGKDGMTERMAQRIATNYPNVPIFQSFKHMISEFPPDTSLEPSPDTDPDFWTRS